MGFQIVNVPWGRVNYRQFGNFPTHVADCSQVPLEPGGFTPKFGIGLDMSVESLGLPQSLAPGEGGAEIQGLTGPP